MGRLLTLTKHGEDRVWRPATDAVAEIYRLRDVNANLLEALRNIKRFGELGCVDVGARFTGGKKPATKDVWQFPRHMLVEIEEAIAKAEGQS